VEEGGKAVRRAITPGGRSGGRVQVTDGLKAGDRLIVSGSTELYDGLEVDVKEQQ